MNWHVDRTVAPEPSFSRMLQLLEKTFVRWRSRAANRGLTSDEAEELRALMDALHNVPAFLGRYGEHNDEESLARAFEAYNARAARNGWMALPAPNSAYPARRETD